MYTYRPFYEWNQATLIPIFEIPGCGFTAKKFGLLSFPVIRKHPLLTVYVLEVTDIEIWVVTVYDWRIAASYRVVVSDLKEWFRHDSIPLLAGEERSLYASLQPHYMDRSRRSPEWSSIQRWSWLQSTRESWRYTLLKPAVCVTKRKWSDR